ncbi:MAG: TerC family protein [Taibaiella sp.]|nr:TerC family protein [Taibaiella sp.]
MDIGALFQEIVNNPVPSLLVVGNLILIESLLSVDNAAVLATMVIDLPADDRKKALKYGIFGAYFFRGLCLLFASFLVKIWWLKPIGGLYLLYLVFDWVKGKMQTKEEKEEEALDKNSNWIYKVTVGSLGNFWATVALVELMDLAFSIDNVFAAVAFSENIILIWVGVFIGILAMRFVAQGFVALMEKYAFLETCAFVVIGLLGLKLAFSIYEHFNPEAPITKFMESREADWITSGLTVGIFFIPLLTSLLFNFPKRNR